jgi:hypothetical protein
MRNFIIGILSAFGIGWLISEAYDQGYEDANEDNKKVKTKK